MGGHDKLGMQSVPLKLLTPHETKEFTLDLLKDSNISEPEKKQRGTILVELTFDPFKEDHECTSGLLDGHGRMESRISRVSDNETPSGAGLLLVTIQGAEDVEGQRHNNPFAVIIFRGERKKTKVSRFMGISFLYTSTLLTVIIVTQWCNLMASGDAEDT